MRATNTLECGSRLRGTMTLLPSHPIRAVWWREAVRACGPLEWVIFVYLSGSNFLLLLFRQNLPGAMRHFAVHAAVAAGMIVLCWAAARRQNAVLYVARHWYPFVLFIYFFEELHYLAHLVFPRWLDAWLIQFDHALLGVHPTVWLEQFATPALNELMAFCYLTYYFYSVVLAGVLFARKDWRAYWTVMTATATAYVIGYFIALFFPIEGPYHTLRALQHVALDGGPITAVMNVIQRFGRVHGAAFPSLHVAGAFVALLGAWRFERRMFWVFLPLFAAMCVSTVYGRYHYVADIVGGLLVGAVGFAAGVGLEAKEAKEA